MYTQDDLLPTSLLDLYKKRVSAITVPLYRVNTDAAFVFYMEQNNRHLLDHLILKDWEAHPPAIDNGPRIIRIRAANTW